MRIHPSCDRMLDEVANLIVDLMMSEDKREEFRDEFWQ